jgi:hypothetical protein
MTKEQVVFQILPDGATGKVRGRDCWLLHRLLKAGDRGLTTMDLPAGVRASHYIFKLRKAGLVIESIEERHGGQFAGRHSRYRLRSQLDIISDSSKPDAEGITA